MTMITKASGVKADFNPDKLRKSLNRVGADSALIEEVVNEVSRLLTDGMSTHKIYRIAFRLLRKKSKKIASKYNLKKALMQIGTSGYPFEKYIAAMLGRQGFLVCNNKLVKGRCVEHEVDVVAKNKNKVIYVECKYHNRRGIHCDVKVPLYFKSRFIDIIENKNDIESSEGLLVTNTRFTDDALQYGLCAGLKMLSWSYPDGDGLKEMIEVSKLYPITCITSLTKSEIKQLLEQNVILCSTINQNPGLLDKLNIPRPRLESIIRQCKDLCS